MVNFNPHLLHSTYSIVARDAETGQFGVAVQTHQMSVGRVVTWLVPGVGALATQSLTNVSFGPIGLQMLREKVGAPNIIAGLVAMDTRPEVRQIGVVDANGTSAAHTGSGCIPQAGHHTGEGYSLHANMMTNDTVIDAMKAAYEGTPGDLAARMMAALVAAQAEDGDIRGMQSAALKIVPGDVGAVSWATDYDLRVDEHENPVEELGRLVVLRRAQLIDGEGHALLAKGDTDGALEKWQAARAMAPSLEELGFWQATQLADKKPTEDSIAQAAAIFKDAMANEARTLHWLDLINRLQDCGLLEREGTASELLNALGESR